LLSNSEGFIAGGIAELGFDPAIFYDFLRVQLKPRSTTSDTAAKFFLYFASLIYRQNESVFSSCILFYSVYFLYDFRRRTNEGAVNTVNGGDSQNRRPNSSTYIKSIIETKKRHSNRGGDTHAYETGG
jgi:hypothetical protein